MTRLELVRHGQTDWNLQGRIQGTSDIPLNDTGRRQAREAGQRLAAEHWDAIVSSPLSRALETAQIIAAEIGLDDIEIIDDLRERSYGTAEGLSGVELDALRQRGEHIQGREKRSHVVARARPALVELAERHPDQSVLVVTHGGVIGSLVRDVTAYAWPEPGQMISNASSQHFAYADGEIGLIEFNGTKWKPGQVETDPLQVEGL
ncbi:histidine phosphatase family protein [Amnibacterium flavum]|uniref:Histidine phosphatase family protein n=1 Tax=Amnibacterium flavum TaxID=2173173 RepID=A0A2V1HS10_9MICO|nr:histidine phosphatase family protein [Amnibacterium flavum]PVZ94452.1 histidine phosphatase family protein [Amnibacterium flavum]